MSRLAVYVVLALAALPAPVAAAQAVPSFRALFEAIDRAPAAEPAGAGTGLPGLQPRAAAGLFERDSREWIAAADAGARPRRRAVAAAVALFTANSMGVRDWPAAVALLERGCATIRQNDTPTEAERLFHHAANALLQAGDADGNAADLHASHAHRRFPGDPRIVLARAIALEARTWPDTDSRTPNDRDRDLMMRLLDRLEAAAAHDETRAEALVRLAVLASRNRYDAQAVAHVGKVDTGEPFLIYLAALFEGRSEERRKRLVEAEAAYRRALAAVPGAQSAGMALSAMLVREGRVDEAARLMKDITDAPREPGDPWLRYGQGDLRYWDRIVRDLRRSLQ